MERDKDGLVGEISSYLGRKACGEYCQWDGSTFSSWDNHSRGLATITGLFSVVCTTLDDANLIHSLISSGLKLACGREVVTYKTQNTLKIEYLIKEHNSKLYISTKYNIEVT